jgi:hypothetical protein
MDYAAFYADVVEWINQANQAAFRLGMDSSDFWAWVADSTGELCKKYQENRLVIKQMIMLVEWMEEVYETRKAK